MKIKAIVLTLIVFALFYSGEVFGLELFSATTRGQWDWHFIANVEQPVIAYVWDKQVTPNRFYFNKTSIPLKIVKNETYETDTFTVRVTNPIPPEKVLVDYGKLKGSGKGKEAPFTITPGNSPYRVYAQGYHEFFDFWCFCLKWEKEGGGITIDFISDTIAPQSPEFLYYSTEEITYVRPQPDGNIIFGWNPVADRGTVEDTGAVWGVGVASYAIYEKQGETYQTIAVIDEPTPSPTPSVTEAPTPTVAGTLEPTPSPEAFSFATAIPEGMHIFVVTAKDKFGQESLTTINQIDVIVDATGPEAPSSLRLADSYYKQIIVGSENRLYAQAQSGKLNFSWNKPQDLPLDYNVGLADDNTQNSHLCLANISGGTSCYYLSYSNPIINLDVPEAIPNGSYNAMLSVEDKLGNPGATSSPYLFYIDRQAPPAPDTNTININDAYATKIITGNTVSFTTIDKNPILSWQAIMDGTEDWQSGLDAYMFYKYQGSAYLPAERLIASNKSLTGLATGLNRYKIECLDKAGNKSAEVLIEITVLQEMAGAEFITPCYELVSDTSYKILWRTGTGVSYYKAIVKRAAEPMPTSGEWDAAQQIMPSTGDITFATFTNPLFGVDLIAYVLAVGTNGGTSIADKLFVLPPVTIPPGQPYEITSDEYWTGEKTLEASVIIRAGACLYIERDAHLVVAPGAEISITVEGCLVVRGDTIQPGTGIPGAGNVIIESLLTESYIAWKGIIVYGSADITGCAISNAERAITIAQYAAAVNINGCLIKHNRVGIHAYGSRPVVDATTLRDNEWYGIKEDESRESGNKRPQVTNCLFGGNGYNYYHQDKRDVTVDFLNGIPGNGGNIYD